MNLSGFVINLDRRPDRRAEIGAELARVGLQSHYSRFSAVDGNASGFSNPHLKPGEMGCYASHYKILHENLGIDRFVHLVEDDAIFAAAAPQALAGLTDQGLFGDYDIVYTDIMIPLMNDAYKAYKQCYDRTVMRDTQGRISKVAFSVLNLNGLLFGSTSSYLVHPRSVRKVHDLYEQDIAHAPQKSIDLFIRRMCHEGRLKVGCLFPFVTSVRLDHIVETDIVRPYHDMSALAVHLARYAFYIDADLDLCRTWMERCLPLPAFDAQGRILNHLLAFSMTESFRNF